MTEGLMEKTTHQEMVKAVQNMKLGKATGPSEVNVEMIATSGENRLK